MTKITWESIKASLTLILALLIAGACLSLLIYMELQLLW